MSGKPSVKVPTGPVVLEVNNLVKHYASPGGETVRAVDDVSFKVHAGEMVAIYGPSGSGKTTLMLMLAALLEPTSGSILVNCREITSLSEREASRLLRSELAFTQQTYSVMPGTTVENSRLKLLPTMRSGAASSIVVPILKSLGLGERLDHQAQTLSTGERQRVILARGLSTQPRILLADEPTGALDTRRSEEVLQRLTGLSKEREMAIVVVSHDLTTAQYADRAYVLTDGKLSEQEVEAPAGFAGPG